MASIIAVGNKFRAQVRRAGHPVLTKTFADKTEAEEWARKQEVDLDGGKSVGVHGQKGILFGDAVDRFLKETKNDSKTTTYILKRLKASLGKKYLERLTDEDVVRYIKDQRFSPASGAMHFSYLSSVLRMAKIGWKYFVPEIMPHARERLNILGLIGKSTERTRRPTEEELELLEGYAWPTPIPMADIVRFAYINGYRQAEICRIAYKTTDLEKKTTLIEDRKDPKKKKGNNQIVPVLPSALEIIKRQKKVVGDDRIFPFDPQTISTYFSQACKVLGIEDLHFHDLRHEAASRMFELGYKIEEVALVTGHKDWKMLQRYTHLKPENFRDLEAGAKKAKKKKEVEVEVPVTAGEGGIVIDAETFKKFQQFEQMMKMMNAETA